MNSKLIPTLIHELKTAPALPNTNNPYAKPDCVNNLEVYVAQLCSGPFSGHLLVGEAPGYKGCARTGIPFTSERVFSSSSHPFITVLRPSLKYPAGARCAESTATIVWEYLKAPVVPAFWNTFPFHPHYAGNPHSNRAPTAPEIAFGKRYLDLVLQILCPHTIIAVGKTAEGSLKALFSVTNVPSVRHPANGGKSQFIAGMKAFGIR
jgi:uracil-DNA glycosylase